MLSATKCSDQLKEFLGTIPVLKDKIIMASTPESLAQKLKDAKKPAVGILYEGAKRAPGNGGAQMGLGAEVVFTLMLVHEVSVISPGKLEEKISVEAHALLDEMRKAIAGKRAPTGHLWNWQVEAPVSNKHGLGLWGQRWSAISNQSPSGVVG